MINFPSHTQVTPNRTCTANLERRILKPKGLCPLFSRMRSHAYRNPVVGKRDQGTTSSP